MIEHDLSAWKFRRFQELLDVEVWVPRNKATAFTASYAYGEALKRGHVEDRDVVNVFVTRYQREAGVARQLVKFARRLAQESGYAVEEKSIGGVRVIVVSGHDEEWALWASKRHVIKVGGHGIDGVPSSVVESYGGPYPSLLRAGMLEGVLPPGEDEPGPDSHKPTYDPNNPTPDWDRYNGGKKK